MGDITDHGFENLAISDPMIMVTAAASSRPRLILPEQARLPASTTPGAYGRQRGGYFPAPTSRPWPDVYRHPLASVGNRATTEAAE